MKQRNAMSDETQQAEQTTAVHLSKPYVPSAPSATCAIFRQKTAHIYKLVHQNPAEIRRLLHSAKHIVHAFFGCAFKI